MAWTLAAALLWGNILWWASGQEARVSYTEAVPALNRPGAPFTVEVVGANFDVYNDKIILAPLSSNCGDVDIVPPVGNYRTVADYESLICAGGGRGPTKLVCEGVAVYEAGRFRVCVCDVDALSRRSAPSAAPGKLVPVSTTTLNENASDAITSTTMSTTMTLTTTTETTYSRCNVASRFWLGSGTIEVSGVKHAGTLMWRAGTATELRLSGTSLSSRDRIRLVGDSIDCADRSKSKAMHGAVSSAYPFEVPLGVRYDGGTLTETWRNIAVIQPGTYKVCWCAAGLGGCDSDEDFLLEAATIIANGPTAGLTQENACVTGVVCNLKVSGQGLSDMDRIQVISKHHACGNAQQTGAMVIGGGGSNPRTSGDYFLSNFGPI